MKNMLPASINKKAPTLEREKETSTFLSIFKLTSHAESVHELFRKWPAAKLFTLLVNLLQILQTKINQPPLADFFFSFLFLFIQ